MIDCIFPNLALGSAADAWSAPAGIDAMLCVAREIELPTGFPVAHKVPIVDMQPIPARQMAEVVEWIAGQIERRRVLVFCNAGVGRSSSSVIAYLCCCSGYGFGEAVEYVARRRPYISILPNLLPTIEEVQSLQENARDDS